MEDVAIYKRFLTENSIYSNSTIGEKNILVFMDDSLYQNSEYLERMYNGNLTDNIYLEKVIESYNYEYYTSSIISEYVDNLYEQRIQSIKNDVKSNQGAICQLKYYLCTYDEGYYCIYETYAIAKCSKEYYQNEAFKDYEMMKYTGISEGDMIMFSEYQSTDDLKIETETIGYYLNSNGEFIGNDYEEAMKNLENSEEETEDDETMENLSSNDDTTENEIGSGESTETLVNNNETVENTTNNDEMAENVASNNEGEDNENAGGASY
jgi:hypothetical protein